MVLQWSTVAESVTPRRARLLGLGTCAVGLVLVALYPLHDPGALRMPFSWPVDGTTIPGRPDVRLVAPSALLGPLLVTWGTFAAWSKSLVPLTTRRALLAPALGVLALGAGLGRYVLATRRVTPVTLRTDVGRERTFDPTVVDLLELAAVELHLLAIAGVAALVVGVAVRRRGARSGVAAALLPASVASVLLWFAGTRDGLLLLIDLALLAGALAVLGAVPFAVGYLAADRRRSASSAV